MHLLIGFIAIVGLIGFAFGTTVAVGFVRACLLLVVAVVLYGIAYVAIEVLSTPNVPPVAKIPESTTELRRTCAEWRNNPNEAPRMCFAVLEQMER